jgi:Autographiviridae endonuclease VII
MRGVPKIRHVCKECRRAQHYDHSGDPKPEGRICTKCGIYKPLLEFHKYETCLYGVEPIYKLCRLKKRREYRRKYPARIRNADLKARYGMTIADYEAMYERQGGRCAICGTSEEKLVVDHNHQTNSVRELLCHLCNTLIGCAHEDIAILASAPPTCTASSIPDERTPR